MNEGVRNKVEAAFKAVVTKKVNEGQHSRWGVQESVVVVEELTGLLVSDEEVGLEGFGAIAGFVEAVINPSAFAQRLEALPSDHPRHIKRAERGKGQGKVSLV